MVLVTVFSQNKPKEYKIKSNVGIKIKSSKPLKPLKPLKGPNNYKKGGQSESQSLQAIARSCITNPNAHGGDEITLQDLEATTDLPVEMAEQEPESLDIMPSKWQKKVSVRTFKEEGGPIIFETRAVNQSSKSDVFINGMDTIQELKEKIFIVTGIPPYRQHLFITSKVNKHYARPLYYSFIMNGAVTIDIRTINEVSSDYDKELARYLNLKDIIKIEGLDEFITVQQLYNKTGTNHFNLVDLNSVLNLRYGQSTIKSSIGSGDKYIKELLYWGLIAKYFPMITEEIYSYILDPSVIQESYPMIYPSLDALVKKYRNESTIMKGIHDSILYNRINNDKISEAIVTTVYNMPEQGPSLINIRNLFDLLILDKYILATKAIIISDGSKHLLSKSARHVINKKKPYISSNMPRNDSILISIAFPHCVSSRRHDRTTICISEIIISSNGRYEIISKWGEDQKLHFTDILEILTNEVNPLINIINKLNVFNSYSSHLSLISSVGYFTGVKAELIWQSPITSSQFDDLSSRMEDLLTANIIAPLKFIKPQIDKKTIEFNFRKGMTEFDPSLMDYYSNVPNYYSWMSDSLMANRHAKYYDDKRVLRIFHRSSDVKVVIDGLRRSHEYDSYSYIIRYILAYLSDLKLMHVKKDKKLKMLKEKDPKLFNFKSSTGVDTSSFIYSKKCQQPHQPTIITDDEAANLQPLGLIKYWNFTENRDQWYQCPTQFPNMRFITGVHPNGYCMPCCKKIEAEAKASMMETCFETHEYHGDKITVETFAKSRYIMEYGRPLESGRLQKIPNDLEVLLYDTLLKSSPGTVENDCENTTRYCIVGVNQTFNNVNISMINVVAMSLTIEPAAFFEVLIKKISKETSLFSLLLNGELQHYFSVNRFVELLHEIKNGNPSLDVLTFKHWNAVIIELTKIFYGIYILQFYDSTVGITGDIHLRLPKGINDATEWINSSNKYLLIMEKDKAVNPIFVVDPVVFNKTKMQSIEKKLFDLSDGTMGPILKMVRVHISNRKINESIIRDSIDLHIIKQFCSNSHSKWRIAKLFINKRSLCYCLLLEKSNKKEHKEEDKNKKESKESKEEDKNKKESPESNGSIKPKNKKETKESDFVYVPIVASFTTEIGTFEPFSRKSHRLPLSLLAQFINEYNAFIIQQSKNLGLIEKSSANSQQDLTIYPLIKAEAWLQFGSTIIGFKCNGMYFYMENISQRNFEIIHKKHITKIYNENQPDELFKIVNLQYDPDIINSTIYHMPKKTPIPSINRSLYNTYIYTLFQMEFMALFKRSKDTNIRNKIKRDLMNIIKKHESLDKFADDLRNGALKLDQGDIDKILSKLHSYNHGTIDLDTLFNSIDNGYFLFDNIALLTLRGLSHDQLVKKLQSLGTKIFTIANSDAITKHLDSEADGSNTYNISIPNVLSVCSNDNSMPYCKPRLLLDKRQYDIFLDIFARDILNPLKIHYLASLGLTKIINEFNFTVRPHEKIKITEI